MVDQNQNGFMPVSTKFFDFMTLHTLSHDFVYCSCDIFNFGNNVTFYPWILQLICSNINILFLIHCLYGEINKSNSIRLFIKSVPLVCNVSSFSFYCKEY